MPPFISVSKTMRRLLSGKNGLGLLTRSSKSGTEVGKNFQARCFSSIVGVETPCVSSLIDGEKDLRFPLHRFHNAVQSRNFISCGNGGVGDVLYRNFEEKRIIGYSTEQLFSVVAAVDLYEDFLPWCQRSRVLRCNADGSFDAEMEIGFKFFVERYISHVVVNKPKSIKTTVSDSSLFDHLINLWEFNPGPVSGTCDLYFFVDFKFQSPLYGQMASMFFKEVVSRLVASFSDRCRLIYGPGVQVLENSYGEQRM